MVSVTAVGYGDLPVNPSTRIFCTFYLPIAVSLFGAAAAAMVNLMLELETKRRVDDFVKQGVSREMIMSLDADKTGSIDKYEFAMYVLVGQGKLAQEDVTSVSKLFDSLDKDKSGSIDFKDIPAAPLQVGTQK